MRRRRTFAGAIGFVSLSAVAILLAQEQTPRPPDKSAATRVQGFILDRDTRQPLAGVTVQAQPNITVSTDQNGHFAFESFAAPPFRVTADAAGYASAYSLADGQSPLELTLVRLAEIRGVLVDADTKKPLAHVRVSIGPAPPGNPSQSSPVTAPVTAEDGSFRIQGLNGGLKYYVRMDAGPKPSIVKISAEEAKSDEAQKQREAAEKQSFGVLYWPGGGAEIPNGGILPGRGGIADIGEVRLRPVRLRKLAAWIDSDCEEGDITEVVLQQIFASGEMDHTASAEIPCGGGLEVQNLPEGSFVLGGVVISRGVRQIGSQQIDDGARGPLDLRLVKPVLMTGTVELEGVSGADFPTELANLPIQLFLQTMVSSRTNIQQLAPNQFETPVYPGEIYRLDVNLPRELDRYYVKRVIADGALVENFRFRTFGGGLRIVMSNHPAVLDVQVQSGDKPQAGVTVVVGKDGGERGLTTYLHDAKTDQQGRAVLRGLEPGRYRAIALTPSAVSNLVSTDNAMLLSSGTAVTLEEGQTATVTLSGK
jgi:hypothetical protein